MPNPNQRVQVGDLRTPELIQPKATPVSTLRAPSVTPPPQTNGLLQLGEALSSIQPSLNQFLDRKMDKVTQEEIQRGQEAQLKNKAAFKDAVNKGLIPAGASPWFVQGYQKSEQQVNGIAFDQSLREAWAGSEIRNSDDPDAFKSWVQSYTQQYLEHNKLTGTPMFHVLADAVRGSQANLAAHHIGYRQQQIEETALQNTQQTVLNILDNPMIPSPKEEDKVRARAGMIQSLLSEQVASGMNGQQANKLTVDSVVQKALENEDVTVLTILDHINTGNGPLGNTEYARKAAMDAENRIWSRQDSRSLHRSSQEKHLKDQMGEAVLKEATERLLADPTARYDDLVSKANEVDQETVKKVLSLRGAMITAKEDLIEDGTTLAELQYKAKSGTMTLKELTSYAGQVKPSTLKGLSQDLAMAKSAPLVLSEPMIKDLINDVQKVVGKPNPITSVLDNPVAGYQVSAALWKYAIELNTKGDDLPTIHEKLQKYSERLIKQYVPDKAQEVNTPVPKPEEATPKAPAKPAASAPAKKGDAVKSATLAEVQAQAKASGTTLDQMITHLKSKGYTISE